MTAIGIENVQAERGRISDRMKFETCTTIAAIGRFS